MTTPAERAAATVAVNARWQAVQLYHPKLDRTITVPESAVSHHERSGWVKPPAPRTEKSATRSSATKSEETPAEKPEDKPAAPQRGTNKSTEEL